MKLIKNKILYQGLLRACTLSTLLTLSMSLVAYAETRFDLVPTPREKIEKRFSNSEISSISCDDFGTLCQVISGSSVFYVNPNATHAFIGRVFDLETNRDLTELAIKKLKVSNESTTNSQMSNKNPISWASLPLHDAITRNKNGKYEVAVISDINCGYCRNFSSQVHRMSDVKVYEFLIGSGATKEISNRIACSEAPVQALETYYSKRQFQSPDCNRDITESANRIASQIGLQGTPTFIRPDGEILVGFESIQSLRKWVTELSAQ